MDREVRVRYAPSPTGHLHIGNARAALFNYLYARHANGIFVIRIEDTDQKRNVQGGEQNQLNYLRWLGIDWDESIDKGGPYGPYRQTERLDLYEKYWRQLLEQKLAYPCYCTEEELEKDRRKQLEKGVAPKYTGRCRNLTEEERKALEAEGRRPSIRFKVPRGKQYIFDDLVKGRVNFDADGFGDFVIVKKDGIPTYNFAVAVDDYLMKITHVLRGDDHISNTPRQLMIFEAFGWDPPKYGHMALIVNEEHKKLSKRDESIVQFIEQYEALGYLPEALFNFIALLGWSPGGEEEIFSREELIRIFDPDRLSSSPAVFDVKKLNWMNNQYIKKASLEKVLEITVPHLEKAGKIPLQRDAQKEQWVRELIGLYQEQLAYGAEIVEKTELFFKEEVDYSGEAKQVLQGEKVSLVLQTLKQRLQELESYEASEIFRVIKAVQKETGQKGKRLFMPIRVAATGQTHGPELPKTLYLLGKETVLRRIDRVLETFAS